MQIELELEERAEGSEVSLRCRTFLRIHDVGLAENACRCVTIRADKHTIGMYDLVTLN